MKQKKILLLSAVIALLTACGTIETSSTGQSSIQSLFSSEATSQKSESVSISVDDGPTRIYGISENYISAVYNEGSTMITTSSNPNSNFLILDEDGRIMYTAAFTYYGYGTRATSYHSSSIKDLTDIYKSGTIKVPSGMKGYDIQSAGYSAFMKEISNGKISDEDAKNPESEAVDNWNSQDNKYLSDEVGIRFQQGDDDMDYRNNETFRLSSLYDVFGSDGKATYLMEVPYNDEYEISADVAFKVSTVAGDEISKNSNGKYLLTKGDKVAVTLEGSSFADFNLNVTATKHLIELPYEVNEGTNLSEYSTTSDEDNPLVPADLKVTKRDDGKGLYVNCNNPEALYEDCLNTVLTGQEVTDKEVFFTYEHNNKISTTYYYGYRVTNTGDTDIYITVKNLGNQIKGSGSWLGEDEWIKFYNMNFRVQNLDNFTASQKKNYKAYLGFSNEYESENRQPITYRVPAGKYIYVMGGTSKDAYKNINVFNSADEKVNADISGCSNGAVLFSVTGGKAYGQFMAYSDDDAKTINQSEYVKEHKEYGYATSVKVNGEDVNVGHQYAGYDNCHGVVDTNLEWEVGDSTPSGYLPVAYENPFYTDSRSGTPYSKITDTSTKKFTKSISWVTHINPSVTTNAIGTDMTDYITTDHETGKQIILGRDYYDGLGETANIGNWMVDYIDTITIVNTGDEDRSFTHSMIHNGTILAFVRDENGNISSEYDPSYQIILASSSYGDGINEPFSYTFTVPAHSVKRYSVDYNLLANSCGLISHSIKLNKGQ